MEVGDVDNVLESVTEDGREVGRGCQGERNVCIQIRNEVG